MISILLAHALVLSQETIAHTRFHPHDTDLFVEVQDARAIVDRLRTAPTGRFVDDAEVQKLGALTKQLGFDLATTLRASVPRMSIDMTSTVLIDPGDLGHVTISWSGLDGEATSTTNGSERTGVVMVCDFATEASAARCTNAFRAAGWLTERSTTESRVDHALSAWSQHPLECHKLTAFGFELDAWSLQSGARWVLLAGAQTPEQVASRLAARIPSLPGRDELFSREKDFTPSAGVVIARVSADLATVPFVETLDRSGVAAQLVNALVPFAGRRGYWRIELRGDKFVTEGDYERITSGGAIDELQEFRPIARESARLVPKEAVGAWLLQIRPGRIRQALDTLLGTPSNEAEQAERDAKLDGLFARGLGSNASISMLPITSLPVGGTGSIVPRILATFELADRAAFQAAFVEFIERSKARNPGLTVEERPYRKVPITVFENAIAPESAPAQAGEQSSFLSMFSVESAKPCVVVLEDRVLVTLSPTHARAEVQRHEKREKEPELHPLATEGRFPSDVVEASTIDWSGLLGKLYDMARGFAPMLARGDTLSFDPATLPASSSLQRFFQPSYSWTKKTERGLYTYSESSFGPETPIILFATIAGLSRTPGTTASSLLGGGGPSRPAKPRSEDASSSSARNAPGATTPAKDEARERTLAAMRSIKTGIAVYRAQTGTVPATLAVLLEGTESFPNGFLDPRSVPKDGWQAELRYVPDADAKKYRLWSLGPDSIDQQGAGDDVLAP